MFAEWRKRPLQPGSGVPLSMAEGRTKGISVVQTGVPFAPTLGRDVEDVPGRREQVDPSFADLVVELRVTRVEVSGRAVRIKGEDGDGRVLLTFVVLRLEVVLERAVAATQQAYVLPAAVTSVRAQRRRIGSGSNDEVH